MNFEMPEVNVEKYCLIFPILSRRFLHLGGVEELENALMLGLTIPHPGGVKNTRFFETPSPLRKIAGPGVSDLYKFYENDVGSDMFFVVLFF